jgi:hypothetical protein
MIVRIDDKPDWLIADFPYGLQQLFGYGLYLVIDEVKAIFTGGNTYIATTPHEHVNRV